MASTDPLDMAAELADVLGTETVDIAAELALPSWDDELAEEPPRRRWRVDSDSRADYALRRVAMCDEEAKRIREFAAEQVRQIEQWRDARLVDIEATRTFFHGSACDYARRLREADPSFRTLPLPAGKLTAHDNRAGIEVLDSDAFCLWALGQGHDDVVKVEMTPKLRDIPKRYTVDAGSGRFVAGEGEEREVVPGIVARPAGWRPDAKPEPLA